MKVAVNILAFIALMYVLRAGASIFLPFVAALFLWMLIWIFTSSIDKAISRMCLPEFMHKLSRIVSIIMVAGAAYFIISQLIHNIRDVAGGFAKYQANIAVITEKLSAYFEIDIRQFISLEQIVERIDVPRLIASTLSNTANIVTAVGMTMIYLLFMLLEENSLKRKMPLLIEDDRNGKKAYNILHKILEQTKKYLLIKTFLSAVMAIMVYGVFRLVGLDYALLFAILVFVLNYIPTIGTIASSIPPITMALLQFEGAPGPFFFVTFATLIIQIVIGNLVEPKVMGSGVGISPLVQIVAIVVTGWIWGAVGMFLCVPIMIIAIIVMENIPKTRKIAILLGDNKELQDE